MNIIIPIGGKGTRFSKNGYTDPKPLIKILDKFMIDYVIDNLVTSTDIKLFIIYNKSLDNHKFSDIIKNKYPNVILIPINVQTSGASETINLGLNTIIKLTTYKKCLILDCDTFYTYDIVNHIKLQDKSGVYYFMDNGDQPLYSYIELDSNNKITKIREKDKISNYANTGAYYFNDISELHQYSEYIVENKITFNGECYTSCIINEMIIDGIEFYGHKLDDDKIYFLGTPNQVNNYINNAYAFLFDLDGTLVDTDEIYFSVWTEILNKYNLYLNEDVYHTFIHGNNDYKVISMLFPNSGINIEELSKYKDDLFIKNLSKIKIKSGTLNFINRIKQHGHKVCIVSNCNRYIAMKILEYFNLDKIIDHLIIGNECNRPKPYPDPYIKALEILNIPNNRSIIFEDSKTGLLSASGTLPLCIVGIQNNNNEKLLKSCGANIVIDSYDNLLLNDLFNYKDNKIDDIKDILYFNLNTRYDIQEIIINNNKLKGGYISDVLELIIKLNNGTDMNCVLKLENKQSNKLSDMANLLELYKREYYFYENIYNYIDINVPKFHGVIKDKNFSSIGILLENLNTNNFKLNLDLNKQPISVSLNIIDKCIKLHARFWDKPLIQNFPNLTKNNKQLFKWTPYIHEKWPIFKNRWAGIISDLRLHKAEIIVQNFEKIENYLSSGSLTLCHGDVKSANMFFKIEENNIFTPYFIDWQYIVIGKGVQDLVFFMIESFSIETINKYANLFIEYYYIKLSENGITKYTKEEYLLDLQASICYFPFFVAMWFGTVDSDELIDKNFPFFFIQKLFNFMDKILDMESIKLF
jgi:beta-phosphoglucomutase-like phosphatase (HAD superfamily)/molybdopterin-guanine dinucleotide biosynthesis protein A